MATIRITLFKGKKYEYGGSPVMLRVTHQRKSKYFSLGLKCNPDQWDGTKERFNRKFNEYREKNRMLDLWQAKAGRVVDDLIRDGQSFTFERFEFRFLDKHKSVGLFQAFDEIMEELRIKEKVGNLDKYKSAKKVLQKFSKYQQVMLQDINYAFLKKFEAYLFDRGCSGGGVSFHMRTLRALINESIRRGYMDKEDYPFSTQFNKNGYSLRGLKSAASPRALSEGDMEKIKQFPYEEYPELGRAVRYFLFSYYARGINFIDMAKLRKGNIYDGRLRYNRSKTGRSFNIKLSKPLIEIIAYFEDPNSDYLFPILNEFHVTPQQVKYRAEKCLKQYNAQLAEVAKVLKIKFKLTSYVARHTYATTLKRKNVDISVISEGLGHSEISTTKAYLEKFSTEVIDAADQLL